MFLPATRAAAGLFIAVAMAAAVSMPTAHAVDASVLFIRYLRQHGIEPNDLGATGRLGLEICERFDEGGSYPQVLALAQALPGGPQLDSDGAAVVVEAAVDTMCSQFADRLPS
ncbi:MAG: DUF732 domain-containing protein [Mycobacterium sp.]